MAFSKLLQHEIDISRLTAGVGVQKSYVAIATSVKTFMQPMTEEQTALHGLAMGKAWKCYVDPTVNVQAGDKVDWLTQNQRLRVVGVSEWQNTVQSKNAHKMLLLSEEDS